MATALRVTHAGSYIETVAQSIQTTHIGAYVETEPKYISLTHAGIYIELDLPLPRSVMATRRNIPIKIGNRILFI